MIKLKKIESINVDKLYNNENYEKNIDNTLSIEEENYHESVDEIDRIFDETETEIDVYNTIDRPIEDTNNSIHKKSILIGIIFIVIIILGMFFIWKHIDGTQVNKNNKEMKTELGIIQVEPEIFKEIQGVRNSSIISEKNKINKESLNNPILSTEDNKDDDKTENNKE